MSGNEIKQIRTLIGWTQLQVARAAGLKNWALISLCEARGLRLHPRQQVKVESALLAEVRRHADECARILQKLEAGN